jgi:PHD/YefM family antitoxin component YafN of YafNO toxin-antitoxin module
MTVKLLDSNQARNKWREMLDDVLLSNVDVVITRYNQPMVTVVAYADYLAVVDELTQFRAERARRRVLAESKATLLASEHVLARDWESPEEDAAWADL